MPIVNKVKNSDLLAAKEAYIAHGVNCLGTMGAGLAREIAKKWPESEAKYKEFCWKHPDKKDLLGKSLATHEKKDGKVIFHMFTQLNVGVNTRQVDYGAIGRSFSELNNSLKVMKEFDEHMEKEYTGKDISLPMPTVAIPKIGAGLGGGSWNIIEEIINGCTPDINIKVYEL